MAGEVSNHVLEKLMLSETTHQGTSASPTAFRMFFDQQAAFVCQSLRMLGIATNDLEDALQEVFLVVLQRLHDYEERGRVRAWLSSISKRVAWNHKRTSRRRQEDCVVDYPELAIEPEQYDRAVEHEELAVGYQLLQRLTPPQRDVFWLHEVEDLPMSVISRVLGCPMQTAYSRLHKARERVLTEAELVSDR